MAAPTWAEPPPIGGPQDPRAAYVEKLRLVRNEPGRWAIIKSGTPSACHGTAGKLRTRQLHIPPGEWEFKVRTFRRGLHVGDMNVAYVYARFIGDVTDFHEPKWEGLSSYKTMRRGGGPYERPEAVYSDSGLRLCPECMTNELVLTPGSTTWPSKCVECWQKTDSKYARKRWGAKA